MITKISVGDNYVLKYNSPKIVQVLKIHEYDTENNWVRDDIKTITVAQAASCRYHVDVLILCNAQTGKKLNSKRSYNASMCECLSEFLDKKRALITQLEKLIT